MSHFLTASLLAKDLWAYLAANEGKQAQVQSIYSHALNLLAEDGELITLADPTLAIMPMGLVIGNKLDSGWDLKPGERVNLGQKVFKLNNSITSLTLDEPELWNPNPILTGHLKSKSAIAQTRFELIDWLKIQPTIGLLPLLSRLTAHRNNEESEIDDPYSRYIAADLSQFVKEILDLDWPGALKTASKLVGYGIGSTPSCDDFLAAYLVVLFIAQSLQPDRFSWVEEFNQGIATLAMTRTTLVSAHMLNHAASGKLSQPHQNLVHACLFDTEEDVIELAKEVSKTGASSGMDFLLGLTCALEWFITNAANLIKGGKEQAGTQRELPVTIS